MVTLAESSRTRLTRATVQRESVAALGRRLLAEVVRDCGAAEATLWLISLDGLRLEGTLNCGPTPHILERESVPLTESVIGMVASNGLATSIGSEDYHHPGIDRLTGTRTSAMIAAPIYLHGRLGAVLSAINPVGRELFVSEDLEKLSWKAYLLGLVLADATGRPE